MHSIQLKYEILNYKLGLKLTSNWHHKLHTDTSYYNRDAVAVEQMKLITTVEKDSDRKSKRSTATAMQVQEQKQET